MFCTDLYYVLSSESLCVVNSLRSSKFTMESDSVLKTVRKGPLGINSLSVEIFCEFSPGKQGVSETLPYCFATGRIFLPPP